MIAFDALRRASRVLSADSAAGAPVAAPTRSRRGLVAAGLLGVAALAVVLRLVPVIFDPSINWWDEVFQTTEQAHRLVYGYGLVPWEFQLGMRSWLLPGVVAGLMELARLVGEGPDYYLPVIAAALGALAAAPVVCCFLWCRRWFGLVPAFVGAAAVAIAPELVYFGARALSEVVAAHLLVIALYLAEPGCAAASRRRLFSAGVLFGFVCLLRIQVGPAVAVAGLWWLREERRARLPALLAGGAAALAFGALLDAATLGYPFASLWRDVVFNLFDGVSSGFGVEPWSYYLVGEFALWNGASLLLLIAIGLGARRMPPLLAAAIVILAAHSAIAHKEYRFIYPAVVLVMVLGAIGLAQIAAWGGQWLSRQGLQKRNAALASGLLVMGVWAIVAYRVWTGDTLAGLRQRVHDNLLAATFVRRLPALCGVGYYGEHGRDWARYGGYTYLHRRVPIFWPEDRPALIAAAPAFDVLLYKAPPPKRLGFKTIRCFGRVCVARRAGGCAARPMPAMPFPAPLTGMAPPRDRFEALPEPAARPHRSSRR